MKRLLFLVAIVICCEGHAQMKKPVLVVGMVVDQMRNDYIYRYWNRFGEGGFKRLVNNGFYLRDAHFNYIPTYTGPGHASIYTGSTPRHHGIIGNEWYDRARDKFPYCVTDTNYRTVGAKGESGRCSPVNLLCPTIGDELRMTYGKRSKIIGLAIKDRSSILPAGHAPDAAYWLDAMNGQFITSTYYLNELPMWLQDFNNGNRARKFLEGDWTPLYDAATYSMSIADDNKYEEPLNKKDKPVFPYNYKAAIEQGNFSAIRITPFGNTLTKDAAKACITGEQLGKDGDVDLLCVSFSSSDIITHGYGPRSMEVEDMYLRLDKDIEDFLNFLDKEVGKDNYTLFLTADHGGSDVTAHLRDNRIPAGTLKESDVRTKLRTFCRQHYNDSMLITTVLNEQVYLNEKHCAEAKLDVRDLEQAICAALLKIEGISESYGSATMRQEGFANDDSRNFLQNGYNHRLSGNVLFTYRSGWQDYSQRGTTHGSGYNYDTHVPVIFYGAGVRKGESLEYFSITRIAPTICELLKISQPGCTSGEVFTEIFR